MGFDKKEQCEDEWDCTNLTNKTIVCQTGQYHNRAYRFCQ
jgi:hypothetical protein